MPRNPSAGGSENLPPLDVEQVRQALRAAKGKIPDDTHQLFQGMLELPRGVA
jgi:hypothetical protein